MYEYYLTFQSSTLARRASEVLKYHGIRAPVVSAPAHLSSDGCIYSIKLMRGDLEKGKRYLAQNMIPYRDAFYGSGQWQSEEGDK